MKIYIDFDGTIYNSNKLNQRFINIFKEYNINENYINKLIDSIKNYNIISKKLINEFNLNKEIISKIDNIYSDELVFKDTISFLKKYYKKYDLILLTFSNDLTYQQKKINSSKLNKYFKNIIISNKNKSKLNNVDYINGIFIDNNPLELKKFYHSKATKLIRIKRDTDKYSKIDLNINIPEFKNFEDLLKSNYIEKLGETKYE